MRRLEQPVATAAKEQAQQDSRRSRWRAAFFRYVAPGERRERWYAPLGALVACAIALAFNLYRLGAPSIWFDEAFSVQLSKQPVRLIVHHYIWGYEAHMGLYYLFMHFWLLATGALGLADTEVLVRLPSAVFAALATAVVFALGWRFFGRTAGIVGAALVLLGDQQLNAAQSARSYALQLLMCAVSWYVLLAVVGAAQTTERRRNVARWAVYTLATTVFVYAHLFSVLVVIAQAVAIGAVALQHGDWGRHARRALPWMAASLAGVVLLSSPILISGYLHGGSNAFFGPVNSTTLVQDVAFLAAGDPRSVGYAPLLALMVLVCAYALVLAVIAAVRSIRWSRHPHLRPDVLPANGKSLCMGPATWTTGWMPLPTAVTVLSAWIVVPLAIAYVATQPAHDYHLFLPRYLVVIVAAICLLVGIGISALRPAALSGLAAAIVVLLAVPGLGQYYAHAQVWDMRTPVQWIEHQYQPTDGLACLNGYVCSVNLEYYIDLYGGPAHMDPDMPGRWFWGGWVNGSGPSFLPSAAQMYAYSREHSRIFAVTVFGDGGAALDFLTRRYQLVSQYKNDTVTVSLFDTRHMKPFAYHSTLFLGDSLTAGYYASDQAHTYRALVDDALSARDVSTSSGIYGITVPETLAKLPAALPPADVVIVELGTNDASQHEPMSTFQADYKQLLDRLPIHQRLMCFGPWFDASAQPYADVERTLCQAHGGTYLDLIQLFASQGVHAPIGSHSWLGTGDGFHPNDAGMALLAGLVLTAL